MSKIEVNAIEPQSGTTLTLGASGDTVVLATGATSSGFGATYNGTVNWNSTIRTSGFTAVSGVGYFCDTSSTAFTVTLPASPAFGDVVAIKDWSSTSATNFITIARNGTLIEGNASNAYIKNHGLATTLVYSGATKGWMVVDSGDVNDLQLPEFVSATGGTVLTCGNYKTHVFTGPGTFTVSSGGNDLGSNSVDYLVVAGGGGGGSRHSGGGGAGGYRTNYPSPTTAGLPVTATSYPITIGAGAPSTSPGQAGTGGTQGSNSVFSTITSSGGGGGAGSPSGVGTTGGSGGGGTFGSPGLGYAGNTPPVSPPQGNPGGNGNVNYNGAGGGGAGAAGSNGTPSGGGAAGGIGSYWPNPSFGPTAPSYGSPGPVADTRYFAGGGGGGSFFGQGSPGPGGAGGSGGGGTGGAGPVNAVAGTANTGGGGGGGGTNDSIPSSGDGGAGGSGIVVIRYKYQ